MKKFLISLILIFPMAALAESLKGSVGQSNYVDYMLKIDLTKEQYEEILKIQNEEQNVIRPYVLDISSKERGLDMLYDMKCGIFEFKCKKKLKEDILKREFEKEEIAKQINRKRIYYNIRYRNVLTRDQDFQVQEMIKNDERLERILEEKAIKKRRQERKEKLKFWKRKKK